MKRVIISDCEGPISKNDNAFETTAHFVQKGDKLFTLISKYDDVLADVLKRPNYTAGNTLKLIVPFLKAYDVTDQRMQEFSAESLVLISDVKDIMRHLKDISHAFIVSTSYEHYILALCRAIGFPYENTYCTSLNINKYRIPQKEKVRLRELANEICKAPMIEIPNEASSLKDFSRRDRKTIQRLDEIFWRELPNMESRRMLSEVNPVGGIEKAKAVKDAAKRLGTQLANVMYVGDSITDVEAFRLVKEKGGLTVSFNGNQYAIRNAQVAVLSKTSIATAIIADVFSNFEKEQTISLLKSWNSGALEKTPVSQPLINRLLDLYPRDLPKVEIIRRENMESLARESSEFRRKVRGAAIGRLG